MRFERSRRGLGCMAVFALVGLGCSPAATEEEDDSPASRGMGGSRIPVPNKGMGGDYAPGTGGTPGPVVPGSGGAMATSGTGGRLTVDGGASTDSGTTAPSDAGPVVAETSYLDRAVPILWFTFTTPISRTPGATGDLTVIEQHDGKSLRTSIDGLPVALSSKVNLQFRGSSSGYFYAQKAYSLELQTAAGVSIDLPVLGMPKESDWVLSSCYADKTCLRNALTYDIGRLMGAADKRWAPKARWAEIYINKKYEGLYLLVEKPKGNKTRVDLPHPAKTAAEGDITGGYMFSADADDKTFSFNPKDDNREFFDARSNRRWKFRYPKKIDWSPENKKYVATEFEALQLLLVNKGAWRDKIDLNSWLDYFLITELSFNQDAFFKSWYFYKQAAAAGGRWSMGPLWDYDIAYGNTFYKTRYCANLTQLGSTPPAFQTPIKDPQFRDEMRCRWANARQAGGPIDVARLDALIDSYVPHIRAAKARDGMRWGNIGKFVWPNNFVGATFDDDVKYLKYWIHKHVPWIDKTLPGVCANGPALSPVINLPPPAPTANDMRMAQGMATPPQWGPADAPSYIPLEGAAPAGWACPPW